MRIAIDARVVGPELPGIARATLGLLEGLHRAPHDDRIAVLHLPKHRSVFHTAGLAADSRFELVEVPLSPFGVRAQRPVASYASNVRADTWHAPYFVRPLSGVGPVVLSAYDLIKPGTGLPFRSDPRPLGRLVKWKLKMAVSVRMAAQVIAPSNATAGELRRQLRVPAERISVIPLASGMRPCPLDEATKVRLGLPRDYVLYLGTNKAHKNLHGLVEAWRRVVGSGGGQIDRRPAHLVLAGRVDPSLPTPEQAHVEDAGALRLRFLPDVEEEDLPRLITGAAAFVFPSTAEGFGFPPLEAMSCGVPVVASNRASIPEVTGDAALLVEPEAEDLAGAITRVLQDAGLRSRLSHAGRLRAAAFSWRRTALQTLAVHHAVAARR